MTLFRAQSLILSLGALALPDVNFYAHCRNFRRTSENLGAELSMLGASISTEKVKSLTVPLFFVFFSLLLLLQSCG